MGEKDGHGLSLQVRDHDRSGARRVRISDHRTAQGTRCDQRQGGNPKRTGACDADWGRAQQIDIGTLRWRGRPMRPILKG